MAEARCRRLARRPQLQLPVLPVRHAVLRLERRVRDERIHVGAFDDLRAGARERLLDVAVRAQLRRVRALAELVGLGLEAFAVCAAVGCSAQVTFSCLRAESACHQLSATIATPGIEALQVGRAVDDEGVLHAGQRLDLIEVGGRHLGAEDRRLLIHGPQHAGHGEVDAEDRLAGGDRGGVDALHRLADDLVVLRILQRHHAERRHRHAPRRPPPARRSPPSGCSPRASPCPTPSSARRPARSTAARRRRAASGGRRRPPDASGPSWSASPCCRRRPARRTSTDRRRPVRS